MDVTKEAGLENLFRDYADVLPSELDEYGRYRYAKALKGVPNETVVVAMERLAKKISHFPSIAEIFDEIAIITDGECDAYEAWENALEVAEDMARFSGLGIPREKKFKNSDVEKAANRFGIDVLLNITLDNTLKAREQFVEFYNSMIRRKRAGD